MKIIGKYFMWVIIFLMFVELFSMQYLTYRQHQWEHLQSLITAHDTGEDSYYKRLPLPNSKWVLDYEYIEYQNVKPNKNPHSIITFLSTEKENERTSFLIPGKNYIEQSFFIFWSPDSISPNGKSAFLTRYINYECMDKQIIMFSEEEGEWNGPYYFGKSSETGDECYQMVWSEDGTKLALYTRVFKNKIQILHIILLDNKANLLQEFDVDISLNYSGVDYLYWNDIDFVLLTVDYYSQFESAGPERRTKSSQLYSFSSLEPEKVVHHLDFPRVYQILGKDPDSNRILLSSYEREGYSDFIVYDLSERRIIKQQKYPAIFGESTRTMDNDKIILGYQSNSYETNFLSWNWKTLTFTELSAVADDGLFCGWSNLFKSFFYIETTVNSEQYSLIKIKP